jgi:hypothetical protein
MKYFLLLFSLYILTLSSVPCVCEDMCEDENIEQTTQHEQEQDENCTPFCTCACCHTVVTAYKYVALNKKQSFALPINYPIVKVKDFISTTLNANWQPPKMS